MTCPIDKFDVLAAWPMTEGKAHVTPAEIALELEVHPSDVERLLVELAQTSAVIRVGPSKYDLSALGAIVASSPDGGRFIEEEADLRLDDVEED